MRGGAPCAFAHADVVAWLGYASDGRRTYGVTLYDLAWCVLIEGVTLACQELD